MDTKLNGLAVDRLAAAVRERLGSDRADRVRRYPEYGVVEVITPSRPAGTVVVAAISDDAGSGAVVRYANHRAQDLGLRLRVTHVWHRRSAAVTDLLLTSVLFDCLEPHEAAAAERAILHDPDTGRALRALSHESRLLVVSSATEVTDSRLLGDTVASLIGRTACPLAIVLPPATASTAS
jgi:K+-sensing histidine kinase KdpD